MEKDFMWWSPPKGTAEDDIRNVVLERAKSLYENMEEFRSDAFRYFAITDYKHYNTDSETKFEADDKGEDFLLTNPYLTLNVTASCVETASNKIAKIKPRVTFLTKNADREKRELARKLDNWTLKLFKKGKAWKQGSKAFKSACICGLGIVKLMKDKKCRIRFKKVPIFDFFCDNAHRGDTIPEEAGEVKSFTLNELLKMFPSKEKELKEQHGEKESKNFKVWEIIRQYERHFICTENVTLLDEPWDKPLPYQLFKWEEADQGVIGVGLSKKLYAIQSAITYILGKTFQSVRNFAIPRVFVQQGSQPTTKEITNLVAEIIEVNSPDGNLPQFSTPPAVNNQVLDILLMLWQKAFEVVGISSLSAGGQIPRGLEKASGAALRSYQQVESERFQLIRSDYEEAFIEMAKKAIKLSADSMLPKGLKRSDIMEAKDDMQIWTSSLLPETPSGKLAMVGDLFNTGLVTGNQALSLMDSPDVSKFINSETSRMRAIDLSLDRALEKGQKPVYKPALGLELYIDRARKMYAEILIEDEDSEKIPILESCIQELTAKVEEQTKIADALNQLTRQGQGQAPTQQPNQNEPSQVGQITAGY